VYQKRLRLSLEVDECKPLPDTPSMVNVLPAPVCPYTNTAA